MAKYIITQEDLDNNKDINQSNLKVGDEIDIPDDVEVTALFGPGAIPPQQGPGKPRPTKPKE